MSTTPEAQRLQRIAFLIGSIFAHGNFKAETANERELEGLLKANGTFWKTPQEVSAYIAAQAPAQPVRLSGSDARSCYFCGETAHAHGWVDDPRGGRRRGACPKSVPPQSAQPTKLSIQSLWPIMPSGEIDPRSELARSVPARPVGLTDEQIALAMLAVDDPLLWGRIGEGRGEMVRKFARAIEAAIAARSVPEVPAAPSEALLDSYGKWWVPYQPQQAVPAAVEARDSAESGRAKFEEFHSRRKNKGREHREKLFAMCDDGSCTYADDSVQRHWWTWQNAVASTRLGQQGRVQPADAAGSDELAKSADLHQIANSPVPEDVQRDAQRYAWIRDRFLGADFDWGTVDEDGGKSKCVLLIEIESHTLVYGSLDLTIDEASAARKGGEA